MPVLNVSMPPLLEPDPVLTDTSPPADTEGLAAEFPDVIVTEPPLPETPEPTVIEIPPPVPLLLVPDPIKTEPEEPLGAVPVLSKTLPLTRLSPIDDPPDAAPLKAECT